MLVGSAKAHRHDVAGYQRAAGANILQNDKRIATPRRSEDARRLT
jgi:hypothetical protein